MHAREDEMTEPSSTTQSKRRRRRRSKPGRIRDEVLDQLMSLCESPADLKGPDGLLKELMGALITRALGAELTEHLTYKEGEEPPPEQMNRRNGYGTKTVRTKLGEVEIATPRDREGSFEPRLVAKRERGFDGFDDQILAMYARGMSVRDIQKTLEDIYGVEVSPGFISNVTDAVVDELRTWQHRPLETVYPIVYIDALFVKIRSKGSVRNMAIYTVVGVGIDGRKDVLGMWVQETEGAKYWLAILEELRQRGVQDILVL